MSVRPRLGISACLVGQQVRFDGGHKRHAFVMEKLASHVDFVPVCPEAELGLGVPRETLRLVGSTANPSLIGHRSGRDIGPAMNDWAAARAESLVPLDLDGYILKKDSPSCGVARVRVYPTEQSSAIPSRDGRGLFAAALKQRLPGLPLTEEGWLQDAGLRESFLAQIFSLRRLKDGLSKESLSAGNHGALGALVEAHAAHKFLYMAHSPSGQHALGRLVAKAGDVPRDVLVPTYLAQAMALLSAIPTRGKHANVLQHILGFFKNALLPKEKTEVLDLIEEFRQGLHALAVPLTLLVHHLRRHDLGGWLANQVYFEPFPRTVSARIGGPL